MSGLALQNCVKIASGLYLEGLAIDAARDVIWYSDVIGGGIHGVKPDGTPVGSFNEQRMWTGGVLVNADGKVLSSGQGGIMWNDPDSGASGWLIDTIDGKAVNGINEMAPDGAGGIFFGTIDMEHVIIGETPRPGALYRMSADGQVTCVIDEVGFPNGIMHDIAARRLYCNETFRGTWAYDVTGDLGLVNPRFILGKEDADGMALDAEGNVLLTGFRSGHFERISADGTVRVPLTTPAGAITQLRFAGTDLRDVYFHAVPTDGGDTLKEGGEITTKSSFLYRARSPVSGTSIGSPRFTLG